MGVWQSESKLDVRALAALAFVSVAFGGGYIGTAAALSSGFGPLWFQASRLLVASAVLLVVSYRLRLRFPPLRGVAVTGLMGWSVGIGLQTIAQQTVSPGATALIVGTGPLIAVGLDSMVGRVLPAPRQVVGLALGMVGLTLLLGSAPTVEPAMILVLIACIGWSAASVMESRRRDGSHPLTVAAVQMAIGGLGLVAFAVARGEPLPTAVSPYGWLGWAWLAFACATVGMPLWLWVLGRLPMPVAMLQSSASPAVAVCGGALLFGERWTAPGLVGMVLVLCAAAVTLGSLPLPVRMRAAGRRVARMRIGSRP